MFGRKHAPRTATTYRVAGRPDESRRHEAELTQHRAERDAGWYRDVASVWWAR